MTKVRIDDEFWSPRLKANADVTIPHALEKCDRTGRIANFARAAGTLNGEHEGLVYNDSDLYKVIEGASYVLARRPDPKLDRQLDELITRIAGAQQTDGYLNTYFTLAAPHRRWTDLRAKHELYCAGHLFEAAVAHHEATGKASLLDVATKFADLIARRPARWANNPARQAGWSGKSAGRCMCSTLASPAVASESHKGKVP